MTGPFPAPQPEGLSVDSRGRHCPLPIIDLAAAARSAAPGTVITLLADDPAADADVPAWCRMRRHDYLGAEPYPAAEAAVRTAKAYRVRITG